MRIGKLTESALMRLVLGQLHTDLSERLERYGADCAAPERVACSNEITARLCPDTLGSLQPVYTAVGMLPGFENDPGASVTAAANNLAAGGAVPQAVALHVVLPPSCEEDILKEGMKQAAQAARAHGMQVICGHTEVSEAVNRPLYQITGIGQVWTPVIKEGQTGTEKRTSGWKQKKLQPGQTLIVTKWIALAGTAALAEAHEEELHARFPFFLTDQAKEMKKQMSVVLEAQIASHMEECAMHDLSQGGIFGALWEMAQRSGVGLEVDLKRIPVRQETIEVCEYFDINPYALYSAGALLIGTQQPEALIQELGAHGIPAAVIGRATGGNDRIIRNGEDVRFLDRPQQDEWYRRFGGKHERTDSCVS